MSTSYKVAPDLFLVQQTVSSKTQVKPADPPPVNYIIILDCSGSMSWDLPKIREQIKKKVPKLLGVMDTLSIIWFSGRDQFGTLLEAEPVASLTDLQMVNQAIDRWLRPVGLTGFLQPLEEAAALVERIRKAHGPVFSLFFLSDGQDNCSRRDQILVAVEKLSGSLAAATFVEYGYYADRPLLAKMAEQSGGTLIFSEDFDRYAPLFEGSLGKTVSGAPRKEIPLSGDALDGFAFAFVDGDFLTFSVDGGKVTVPDDLEDLWFLSSSPVGTKGEDLENISKGGAKAVSAAYAAVSLYAQRMKSNVIYPILKALGDVKFIQDFSGCFGKQKYSEFMDASKTAVFDVTARFKNGWDPTKVPADDAFTVLDFLRILAEDEDNRVLLDSNDFKYSRISRGQVDASVKAVEILTERIAVETDPEKKKELEAELETAKKVKPLKFSADERLDGYSVKSLTLNESRPNISVLIRKEGTVDLSSRLGKKDHPKLPRSFPTYIWRNYTIVKDGLVNVALLPVRMTGGTVRKLREAGMSMSVVRNPEGETLDQTVTRIKKASENRPVNYVIDLRILPIINRKMVKDVSAENLCRKEYALIQAQADQKVYNSIKKAEFPKESKGFSVVYGEEAAAWLKDQGITDYNGFSPKTVQAPSTDFYMGKELETKIKGLSSLPTLKEARAKKASGKLTPSTSLMVPAIDKVEAFLKSDAYTSAVDPKRVFEAWLDGQLDLARKQARTLQFEIAQVKFGTIIGQVWFTEFRSLDENTLEIDVGQPKKLSCTLEMKEVKVSL